MNINRVVLTGNLTRDPELREVGDSQVCNFSIATDERVKEGGEWTERPSFFDIAVWGTLAPTCQQFLSKGRSVAIDGRLKQERWEKDDEKRSAVRIVAQSVQFLGAPKGDGTAAGKEGSSTTAAKDEAEDIPF